jgi:hypothetical protein
MQLIPLISLPVSADRVQSALNGLIDQINTLLTGIADPTNIHITGGTITGVTIDSSVIGGTTPAAGAFTALTALTGAINGDTIVTLTATQTLTNKALTGALLTGGSINNTPIGATTPATGAFTSLTATGNISGANLSGTNTGDQTILGTTGQITATTASPTTTLAIDPTYVGQTSITTLGTIATGTWNATAISAVKGGTGQTTYAIGDLLYASTTTALSRLADVATGSVLLSGGVGVAPSWGKVALTSAVSGILPPANGGTGVANNASSTLTISGAFATTLTVTAATSITLPTSGTLYGTKSGSFTSAQLLASLTDGVGTGGAVFASGSITGSAATVGSIAANIGAGSNIAIGGAGTTGSPYSVSSVTTLQGSATATNSNTLTNISGISFNVQAAGTYTFIGWGNYTSSNAFGLQVGLGGTATFASYRATGWIDSAGSFVGSFNNGGPGAICFLTSTIAGNFYFDGAFTVNAAGTVTMQFAQNVSGATPSVLVAAFLKVEKSS